MDLFARTLAASARKKEIQKRRLLRIAQVRKQTIDFNSNVCEEFKKKKSKELEKLIQDLTKEAEQTLMAQIAEMIEYHDQGMKELGEAHDAVSIVPDYEEIKKQKLKEYRKKAQIRFKEALARKRSKEAKQNVSAIKLQHIRTELYREAALKAKFLPRPRPSSYYYSSPTTPTSETRPNTAPQPTRQPSSSYFRDGSAARWKQGHKSKSKLRSGVSTTSRFAGGRKAMDEFNKKRSRQRQEELKEPMTRLTYVRGGSPIRSEAYYKSNKPVSEADKTMMDNSGAGQDKSALEFLVGPGPRSKKSRQNKIQNTTGFQKGGQPGTRKQIKFPKYESTEKSPLQHIAESALAEYALKQQNVSDKQQASTSNQSKNTRPIEYDQSKEFKDKSRRKDYEKSREGSSNRDSSTGRDRNELRKSKNDRTKRSDNDDDDFKLLNVQQAGNNRDDDKKNLRDSRNKSDSNKRKQNQDSSLNNSEFSEYTDDSLMSLHSLDLTPPEHDNPDENLSDANGGLVSGVRKKLDELKSKPLNKVDRNRDDSSRKKPGQTSKDTNKDEKWNNQSSRSKHNKNDRESSQKNPIIRNKTDGERAGHSGSNQQNKHSANDSSKKSAPQLKAHSKHSSNKNGNTSKQERRPQDKQKPSTSNQSKYETSRNKKPEPNDLLRNETEEFHDMLDDQEIEKFHDLLDSEEESYETQENVKGSNKAGSKGHEDIKILNIQQIKNGGKDRDKKKLSDSRKKVESDSKKKLERKEAQNNLRRNYSEESLHSLDSSHSETSGHSVHDNAKLTSTNRNKAEQTKEKASNKVTANKEGQKLNQNKPYGTLSGPDRFKRLERQRHVNNSDSSEDESEDDLRNQRKVQTTKTGVEKRVGPHHDQKRAPAQGPLTVTNPKATTPPAQTESQRKLSITTPKTGKLMRQFIGKLLSMSEESREALISSIASTPSTSPSDSKESNVVVNTSAFPTSDDNEAGSSTSDRNNARTNYRQQGRRKSTQKQTRTMPSIQETSDEDESSAQSTRYTNQTGNTTDSDNGTTSSDSTDLIIHVASYPNQPPSRRVRRSLVDDLNQINKHQINFLRQEEGLSNLPSTSHNSNVQRSQRNINQQSSSQLQNTGGTEPKSHKTSTSTRNQSGLTTMSTNNSNSTASSGSTEVMINVARYPNNQSGRRQSTINNERVESHRALEANLGALSQHQANFLRQEQNRQTQRVKQQAFKNTKAPKNSKK